MTAVTVASGPMMHCIPPLPDRGLTQAGDVGLSTRGRHDALSGAARDVVVDLGTWKSDGTG